jgi:hypothetical protein
MDIVTQLNGWKNALCNLNKECFDQYFLIKNKPNQKKVKNKSLMS